MATENLRELAKDLSGAIAKIRSEAYDVSSRIEDYLKSKKDSRERYDRCLDAGDQAGMGVCLGLIKKANKEIEILKPRFEVFGEKVLDLDELLKKMRLAERKNLAEYETALKTTGEMKKRIDEEVNLCLGAAAHLGNLQKEISEKSRDFGKF